MRSYFKILFSKKIPGVFFLVLQIILLIMPIIGVYERQVYINFVAGAVSIVVIIFEINRQADSGFKLIWIAIIAIFPVFGVFLYIYVHADVILRLLKKRTDFISHNLSSVCYNFGEDKEKLMEDAKDEYGILSYLSNTANAPCFRLGASLYFPCGEDMFAALLEDVRTASSYIFLEFFIINENDHMWKELFSVLSQKAKSGVDVRIIYDAMGCLTSVKPNFAKRMRLEGIRCFPFSPVRPFISGYHNNRDHRKIAIIDGKSAYTGGINIADEYINLKDRCGHWKDTAVRVEGGSVQGFLAMYFKLWSLVSKEGDDYGSYFKTVSTGFSDGYAAAFDDTPLDLKCVTRNVYLHIINTARDYVYINTPYLILDESLSMSLKFAARRGVDVRICMPHIPDKWYVFALSRSYYPELLHAGVKIYEYKRGFIHAKSTVSDDKRAYIGSANYDYRSLHLHYECGVYLCNSNLVTDIKQDFENTLSDCVDFTIQCYRSLSFFYRLSGRVLRLFASLM